MIRLIALDLDGTLLNRDKEISAANRAALTEAMRRGVHVTIATGRVMDSACHFGGLIGANAPLVCCNGGLVQWPGEPPVFTRAFAHDTALALLRYAIGRGWYTQWYDGETLWGTDYRPEYFDAYRTVPGFTVRAVGDRYPDYAGRVLQLILRDFTGDNMEAMLAELEQQFPGAFETMRNVPQVTDLMPPGVDKAVGLAALADHLGLAPGEVMACGDGLNDLAMLRWAGTAIVPADGEPEAKALATWIAPPCDEDAVAAAVNRCILSPGA